MTATTATGDFLNTHKSIMLHMAASLIESLTDLVEEEVAEIDPLEIRINGEKTGEMTPRKLAEEVRKIAENFKPIKMETKVHDHRTEEDDEDDDE
jgi:DNA replication initiation complex subunit (GINS family)